VAEVAFAVVVAYWECPARPSGAPWPLIEMRIGRWLRMCRWGASRFRARTVTIQRFRAAVGTFGASWLWAGIDVGKAHHWVFVVDEQGHVVLSRKVANDESGLAAVVAEVTASGAAVTWAVDIVDTLSALLLALLTGSGEDVRYIAGRVVNTMSTAYVGEGKTDAMDAYVIAETAWLRRDLPAVAGTDDSGRDLALLTARRADLVADRVRMLNRLILLARYALWKNPADLTQHQQVKLAWIAAANRPLHRAYELKEAFRKVIRIKGVHGSHLLDDWIAWASRSRLTPFVELARKIRRHRQAIENMLEHNLSNALIESTNTKIRLLIRMAFGFKNTDALIALAMLALGGYRPTLPGRPAA